MNAARGTRHSLAQTLAELNVAAINDDEVEHLVCCDGEISLCGLYLPDETWEYCDLDESKWCPLCAVIEDDGLPCPVLGCVGDRT